MIVYFIFFFSFISLSCYASTAKQEHYEKVAAHFKRLHTKKEELSIYTPLFKDIQKAVSDAPYASDESLEVLCNSLVLIEKTRRAYAQALASLPHKDTARSKIAIGLLHDIAVDGNDARFNKEAYIQRSNRFAAKYPKKFNHVEKLLEKTGFSTAQANLADHFEILAEVNPNAYTILMNVFKQKNVVTIGQLAPYATPFAQAK